MPFLETSNFFYTENPANNLMLAKIFKSRASFSLSPFKKGMWSTLEFGCSVSYALRFENRALFTGNLNLILKLKLSNKLSILLSFLKLMKLSYNLVLYENLNLNLVHHLKKWSSYLRVLRSFFILCHNSQVFRMLKIAVFYYVRWKINVIVVTSWYHEYLS